MFKMRGLIASVVACVLLLPAAGRAADHLSIMTDWSAYGAHGPLFLAQQKGWFKDADLDVEIKDGKGSTTTAQLLGSGAIDVGFIQLAVMAAAIDKGMAITSVSCFVRAGDNGVMVPVDSPIKEPKDLIGKRIAYPLGGGSAAMMEAFFGIAKLSKSDMNLVGVDSSALASTYVSGNVDAAITTVAYLAPMIGDKRPSRALPYSAIGLRVPSFGLAVRKEDVTARATMLAKLVPILNKAWVYTVDGHVAEAVDAIVAGRPGEKLDRKVMTEQLEGYLKLLDTPATAGHPMGWQAASDWDDAAKSLASSGMIKTAQPAAVYFTNQFMP